MSQRSFATVIGCIDGRASQPTMDFLKQYLNVDFVDYVSEPGPEKVLLEAAPDYLAAIQRKVAVSLNAHHSQVIAIAAHHECAGNPVSREEHERMVQESARRVLAWGYPVRVVGLWVNDQWQLEVVSDTRKAVAA